MPIKCISEPTGNIGRLVHMHSNAASWFTALFVEQRKSIHFGPYLSAIRDRQIICFFKERTHCVALAQVQLGARACDDVGVACALEFAVDGAAGEAAMAGDVNAVGLLHGRGYMERKRTQKANVECA